jgi:hypothetical protein
LAQILCEVLKTAKRRLAALIKLKHNAFVLGFKTRSGLHTDAPTRVPRHCPGWRNVPVSHYRRVGWPMVDESEVKRWLRQEMFSTYDIQGSEYFFLNVLLFWSREEVRSYAVWME